MICVFSGVSVSCAVIYDNQECMHSYKKCIAEENEHSLKKRENLCVIGYHLSKVLYSLRMNSFDTFLGI